MKKITKLTKAQESRFQYYIDKWTEIGLSTDRIDRERHDQAIVDVYALADLPAPKIIYMPCPLSGAKAAAKHLNKTGWVDWLWGNQWAGYAAWADFFLGECGVKVNKSCLAMMQYGHYIWPLSDVCFASERPVSIHLDEQGRSHREDGPSVEYESGWGPYCWHGTRVPKEWIVGEKPSAAEAIRWPNMEQRRSACEILGWVNVLGELDARTIHKHSNPMVGELLEVTIPDIGEERFLQVMCGTNRLFALPVPPEMRTAEEAQRWLNFVPEDIPFIPELRT